MQLGGELLLELRDDVQVEPDVGVGSTVVVPLVTVLVTMLMVVPLVIVLVAMLVVVTLVFIVPGIFAVLVVMSVLVVVTLVTVAIAVVVRLGQRLSRNQRSALLHVVGQPVVVARAVGDHDVRVLNRRDVAGGGFVLVRVVVLAAEDGGHLDVIVTLGDVFRDAAPDGGGGDELDLVPVGGGVLGTAGAGGYAQRQRCDAEYCCDIGNHFLHSSEVSGHENDRQYEV